jgi:hypothetical protein
VSSAQRTKETVAAVADLLGFGPGAFKATAVSPAPGLLRTFLTLFKASSFGSAEAALLRQNASVSRRAFIFLW